MECVLCKNAFPSKIKLVQHFRETHSVAKHRPRRSKVAEGIRQITIKEFEESEDEKDDEPGQVNSQESYICNYCGNQFSTQSSLDSHSFTQHTIQQLKHSVSCIYCGQKCKNSRGATIHQVFCEQKSRGLGLKNIHYNCPVEDCEAIFRRQHQLLKHMKNHHADEIITVISNNLVSETLTEIHSNESTESPSTQQKSKSPMVTVTMKPHVGKTDGLQDLSLLITPSRGIEDCTEIDASENENIDLQILGKDLNKECASITVEECLTLDGGLKEDGQTILCVAEDGSVSETPEWSNIENEKTFLLITEDNILNDKCLRSYDCKFCSQLFLEKDSLLKHIEKNHKNRSTISSIKIKKQLDDDICRGIKRKEKDKDWEFISFEKNKKDVEVSICKGKFEYVCKLCGRSFMSELSYQAHVRNEDCRKKKFKLPRMFSCHFSCCDSSFFKLTELQKHWHIAHKFTMASETHEFEDERAFLSWVSDEETKYKVRFTCDVRRRKPHRSERLMVCHRFHSLRTAAARKAANREYSDKHNWVHKIQPCLCYARMKVYQEFDKNTRDYTGKISVVYYYEHSHPENYMYEEGESILDHILERNRRNRDSSFQELKGSEKVQHRQKLEKFAKIAGKEYRTPVRNTKTLSTRKSKKETGSGKDCIVKSDSISGVQIGGNLLEGEELFDSPVEMVLDGHFDMSHEVFAGPVATHLDPLAIFDGNKLKQEYIDNNESDMGMIQGDDDGDKESDDNTIMLPASSDDWKKLFKYARLSCENSGESEIKTEASLVLPYEKVIGLISPTEQIPIFQQLWELAHPALNSDDVIQVVKFNIVR